MPDQPGKVCCGDDAAAAILAALHDGHRHGRAATSSRGPPTFTAADAQAYGIIQAVGGNNAWRDGAPTTAGPGFTTYHAATGARVTNIHRIADLVRGAVIPPGGSFSINDYVGQAHGRQGVRAGRRHQPTASTSTRSAAASRSSPPPRSTRRYFAGLDIDEYQAHSEYFDRYPRGREATMGYPAPDLEFTNNTPYGILIWTDVHAAPASPSPVLHALRHGRADRRSPRAPTGSCTHGHHDPHTHVPRRPH